MLRRCILGLMCLCIVMCVSGPVRADVVMPPPTDCPDGTNPTFSHAGSYCEPSICKTDADCTGGKVCRSYALCVLEEDAFCGKAGACKIKKGQGPCKVDADCTQPATCLTDTRCVLPSTTPESTPEPSAEPSAEVSAEPSAEPAKEATPEPSAEPRAEPTPDGTSQPEPSAEKSAEPSVNEASPEKEPAQEKVVGEGAKESAADTKPTTGGCGCDGSGQNGGTVMLVLFALLGIAISTWRERSLQKRSVSKENR
ncbi:MAG: hypothetical protein H6727_05660 [Myxococcales bacterium]|nr:hypothetical protein [Myxococcales bacterium]